MIPMQCKRSYHYSSTYLSTLGELLNPKQESINNKPNIFILMNSYLLIHKYELILVPNNQELDTFWERNMILLVGSNKGGSGKTTVVCNLATALAKQGKEVCLVDADKQSSAANWCAERETTNKEQSITIVQKYDNISSTIKSLAEKYEHVIIDVAGRNSREMITAAAISDILLCPSQCSQLDLDTLGELQQQVEQVKDLNPALKVFVYQTMASTNAKVIEKERNDFEEYVGEFPEFKALQAIGRYRKIYRDVFSDGLSVLESTNEAAANEILDLYEEIFTHG